MSNGTSKGLPDTPPELLAPIGRYRGWSTVNKFGRNSAVSTTEDVWTQGGTMSYLSSAELMNIASGSGDDKGTPTAGSGARTVQIYGLDSSYALQNETVTLDGTNNVSTANTYIRMFRIIVRSAGSGGVNAGAITATAASAGTVQAAMAAGKNQSEMTHYTIPDGFYGLVDGFTASVQKGDQATVEAYTREFGQLFALKRTYEIYQDTIVDRIYPAFLAPPKSDLVVRATQVSGGATVSVTASYDFYLVSEIQVNI